MKKFTLLAALAIALCAASCKKDRVCECTTTTTFPDGTVHTDPNDNTTYKEIKKGEAKTLCQRTTHVSVDEDGATSTVVSDCKLK